MTTVLFFGPLAEITGTDRLELDGYADSGSLQAALVQRFPQLRDKKYLIAVNKVLVRENVSLSNASTVALLPPFSGG